jgi:PAS domain S-box-containing protein
MHADRNRRRVSRDVIARALTEAAEAAVVISSSAGVEYANDGFSRLTGLSAEAMAGTTLETLVPIDLREEFAARVQDLLNGAAASHRHEVVLSCRNGPPVPVVHAGRALETDAGLVVVSTFEPVGERRRLARALSVSEARGRQLFDEDACGRFEATPSWQITRCNRALAQMLGCTQPMQLVGRSLLACSPDGPILQKLLAVARAEGRAGPSELQFHGADREAIDTSCKLEGVTDEHGTMVGLRGSVVDVTGSKREQLRLLGTVRMELLARLAGGLAHDFNNLLTIIRGHSERLSSALPADDPLRESARAIDEASAAAASLTRQLLAFGRRQVFELRPLSLARLLADSVPMLERLLGNRIALRIVAHDGIPEVRADAKQIENVIVNLAVNARDAMPSGGTLRVSVETMGVDGRTHPGRQWLRPGRYVRLVIADTGHGMDAVTKAHAFQPFFTTKTMGSGRGLGLATVYGIVKQSNGFVWVESSVGNGATFTLLFPALDTAGAVSSDGVAAAPTEGILVVEPDEQFRTFAGEALRRRGYTVLLAASVTEAIELFASHPSRVHLVVADAGAQTMEGLPLAARLKAIDPMLQSLVVLGAGAQATAAPGVLPTTPVVQKPFTLQALAEKVRSVLDSGEGRG